MAGNVREWCHNATGEHRWVVGGSWADPSYMFTLHYSLPPLDRSAENGFRLALYGPDGPDPDLTAAVVPRLPVRSEPASDDVFEAYRSLFTYADSPLNSRIETVEEHSDWIHERITVDAAYGDERLIVHLFHPTGVDAPRQPVFRFPGAGPFLADRRRPSDGLPVPVDFILKSGRTLVYPVFKGTFERWEPGFYESLHTEREPRVQLVQDAMRTIDYLETRDDLDLAKLSYLGVSLGAAEPAAVILALEDRFRAAVLWSGGLPWSELLPELRSDHYLPRVTLPVLMLNGEYDYLFPVETAQVPAFEQLGTPPENKRHITYDAGHSPLPRGARIRETLDWLDSYVGPVR